MSKKILGPSVDDGETYILYVNMSAFKIGTLAGNEALDEYIKLTLDNFEKIGYDRKNIEVIPVSDGWTRLEKSI